MRQRHFINGLLGSDPADAPAAFAEYAADPLYVWSHLGQFAGFLGLGVGLVVHPASCWGMMAVSPG